MKNGLHNQLGKGFLFAALLVGGGVNPCLSATNETTPAIIESDLVQTRTITGKVVDQKGQPVIGATVIVQNTSRGDITSADGSFRVEGVKVGDNLEVAFIGYVTKIVPVGTETNINVTLEEDALKVEDVVVVGFGTQKKVNLTGAVAAVDSEELLKRPVANVQQMLQGQIPGLNISVASSKPGDETITMNIRGAGSFGAGSTPLVLINGVEGSLSDIDPNSVESVSVLKDAASASIYGSRAANGVILVTTKNGTGTREKFSVSYNMNIGFHTATRLYDVVTDPVEYMELKNMALTNYNSSRMNLYTEDEINLYRNRTDENDPLGKYTGFDWLDYMFRTAMVQNHNIGIAGSIENTSYNINLSYLNQEGTMRGYGYKRYNVTAAIQSQIKSWFKIGANISMMYGNRKQPFNNNQDAFLSTLAQAPTYKPWLVDRVGDAGERLWTGWAFDNEYEYAGSNKNQAAVVENSFMKARNFRVDAQAFFEAQIVKGLTWHTKAAVRYSGYDSKSWRNKVPVYNYLTGEAQKNLDTGVPGSLQVSYNNSLYSNLYTFLRYDYASRNEAHNFSIMAGYSQEDYGYRTVSAGRTDYSYPLYELNAGGTGNQTNSGSSYSWALMSAFGRVNYNYKERYLVEANIRYDGTSRISKDNRWGIFPSFSAGWRLTEEQFMKDLNLSWLNNIKFRGSWGLLGNQNIISASGSSDYYPYFALIALSYPYSFDNSNITTGAVQNAAVNSNIKWETTASGDFGIDLQLFRGLNITFDWYKKRTYDILRAAQVSNLLGLSAPVINDGEMTNTGVEFMIGWNDRVRDGVLKDFGYNASFFITKNKNKLVKFGSTEYGYNSQGNGITNIYQEGLPYGQYCMYEAIGIYESDAQVAERVINGVTVAPYNSAVRAGDVIYRDVNGDGMIDDNDLVIQDGYYPKFNYSINLGFDWKGVDVSMMLQGVAGAKYFECGYMGFGVVPFAQGSAPTKDYVKGMWTEENPVGAKWPRIAYDKMGGNKNWVPSTLYLQKSGFFRLKNLTVGYTIPKTLTQKIGVQKFRVYFSGDNLATATKFKGLDPERYNDGYSVAYPISRICSFGINLQF